MSQYEKESELVAYCGIYCRLCDYYTGRIRDSVENLLEIFKSHAELKLFSDTAKAFDFENFVKGLEWLSNEISPCVGGCRGGGGWEDCPLRKCCIERGVKLCYECNDFPCETLKKFPKRVKELNEIRNMGLESWIKRTLEQT
ncbi:MAG: DUF3795 domain-containing protein [Candidatus Bathyarchaeota archaeon]|nr:DUF3795 domain-containing protein [Candidatus Bathyarchaeota archaeon]MDH5494722.1 DUF3795 domain-containing protein [Candidatus Bathyarchaeota archaeon]